MSDPVPGGGPDPTAEHARPRPRAGDPAGRQPPGGQDAEKSSPLEPLGGADAVEKTTYVVGEGAEPHGRPRGDYIARGAASGTNLAVWIVGGIAALIALVYAIGIFR